MKQQDKDVISKILGVQPLEINSRLVSGQNRRRLYWTNIPGVTIPLDKGILLQSVLHNGYTPLEKARCLLVSDSRPLRTPVKMFHRYYRTGFNTLIFKDKQHYLDCVSYYNKHYKGISAKNIICNTNVFDGVRYLTRNEREHLQTVPTNYCSCLTEKQAADVLGDGWTVDVISHIFSFIP